MAKNCYGLVRRKHTFYIRVWIPKELQVFAKRKEFCFTLGTNDYCKAKILYKREVIFIQLFIDALKEIMMEVKEGIVILNATEQQQALMKRLREIGCFLENKYLEIKDGTITYENIKERYQEPNNNGLINGNVFNVEQITPAEKFLQKYIVWLGQQADATIGVKNISKKVEQNQLKIGFEPNAYKKNPRDFRWFDIMEKKLNRIEDYCEQRIDGIVNNKNYETTDPMIRRLLSVIEEQQNLSLIQPTTVKTPWENVLEELQNSKRNRGVCTERTLQTYNQHIKAFFKIINRNYIQDVMEEDIRKFNKDVYRLPKHWNTIGGATFELLPKDAANTDKALSSKTINSYIVNIKLFLKYAKKQRIISDDFEGMFESPVVESKTKREPFDDSDLEKIFNQEIYPKRNKDGERSRFWIPLIALYSGMRENEICQLYCADIKQQDNIWYFDVTDQREDQHLKNDQSRRQVPIHKVLLELGLLEYLAYIRNRSQARLFPNLNLNSKGVYTSSIEKWFPRHLIKCGIREKGSTVNKGKVFHSFRHTFKSVMTKLQIFPNFQYALGGWADGGRVNVADTVYTHISIKDLNTELQKVKFQIINQIFGIE